MRLKHALYFWLLCSCSGIELNEDMLTGSESKSTKPVTIVIQPFSDLPAAFVDHTKQELNKICPYIQLNEPIALPDNAWYPPRKRYRADTLIYFLRERTPDGAVTIGMTSKDISHSKGNIYDYGLMGLGFCPGKACVVSYFRLSKSKTKEQFFKLCIHELGHTQGLPHCPVKTCFMRDAEGKNHTNEEKEFCPKCKAHLISRGWIFS